MHPKKLKLNLHPRFAEVQAKCENLRKRREFLLYGVDLGRFRLLGRIPALGCHFVVYRVLHGQGTVQRGAESRMNVVGRGFDRAVKVKIANALFQKQNIFHQAFIIHFDFPFPINI